jgi:hypothetical protein
MDIIRIIQETATWIAKVNPDIENNLYRTAELSPGKYYYQIPDEDKDAVVANLVSKRSAMLKAANVDLIPVNRLADYGRIVFFESDTTVNDGAAKDASCCYIDISDAPSFDAWISTERQLLNVGFWAYDVHLPDNLLIAWVPTSQYFYMQEAMDVSMLGHFNWAKSKFVAERFSVVSEIFNEPLTIIEPVQVIDYSARQQRLNEIMRDVEAHFKWYYDQIKKSYKKTDNTVVSKRPFWKRLFNRS